MSWTVSLIACPAAPVETARSSTDFYGTSGSNQRYQVFVRTWIDGRATRTRASTATQLRREREHGIQVELGDLGDILPEA